jgi:hypothetical protein
MTQQRNSFPAREGGDASQNGSGEPHPPQAQDSFSSDGSSQELPQSGSGVPESPDELLCMQKGARRIGTQADLNQWERLDRLMALITEQNLCPWESEQLVLGQLRHLQRFYDAVLIELSDDPMVPHGLIIRWSIKADRLSRCLQWLEEVVPE